MTDHLKISMLAGAFAIAALGAAAASAQTPDTRITVIGAVNDPAHTQQVTDNRDAAVPEMPVVYEGQTQSASAQAQPAPAPANSVNQARAASTDRANLGQTVKSQ